MSVTLSINLDPRKTVYTQGDKVEGFIRLNLFQETFVKDVKAYCEGVSRVKWTEKSKNRSETFKSKRLIFQKEELVARGLIKLLRGSYKIPFSFTLPEAIPSSFESGIGYIRYSIRALYGRNLEENCQFTVNHIENLRLLPLYKNPVDIETYKRRRCCIFPICCCFPIGTVEIKLRTDKAGYVPGENIFISGYIHNKGWTDIRSLTIAIRQVRIFYADRHLKMDDAVVQQVKKPGLTSGERTFWDDVPILVPAVVPYLKFSEDIHIIYGVTVKAELPCCRSVKATSGDIYIGSIPTDDAAFVHLEQPPPIKESNMPNADDPFTCQGVLQKTVRELTDKDFILHTDSPSGKKTITFDMNHLRIGEDDDEEDTTAVDSSLPYSLSPLEPKQQTNLFSFDHPSSHSSSPPPYDKVSAMATYSAHSVKCPRKDSLQSSSRLTYLPQSSVVCNKKAINKLKRTRIKGGIHSLASSPSPYDSLFSKDRTRSSENFHDIIYEDQVNSPESFHEKIYESLYSEYQKSELPIRGNLLQLDKKNMSLSTSAIYGCPQHYNSRKNSMVHDPTHEEDHCEFDV